MCRVSTVISGNVAPLFRKWDCYPPFACFAFPFQSSYSPSASSSPSQSSSSSSSFSSISSSTTILLLLPLSSPPLFPLSSFLTFYLSLLQLLQRFRFEYHHEPLEIRQKMLTVPDKPVKIKFIERFWESYKRKVLQLLTTPFFRIWFRPEKVFEAPSA